LTINRQRTAIERLLDESLSLKSLPDDDNLARVYGKAIRDVLIETDLERHLVPVDCPYRLDDILADDWLTEST
jgi:hypothetical protein